MKGVLLLFAATIFTTSGNEDVLRDAVADALYGDRVEKRAVLNAVGSANLAKAANTWVNNLGLKSTSRASVSKSFEDACLGQTGISTPIRFPTNPWLKNSLSSSIKSKLPVNSLSSLTSKLGKRSAEQLANRDIVFVLDTSGSIPQDQFDKAKKAIAVLIESFCPTAFGNKVSASGTKQISVVLFGSSQTVEVDFSASSRGLGYLQDKILDMKHRREGSTGTGDALKFVREKVLGKGSSRLNNEQVSTDVIVITDGQCNRNCRILGSEAGKIRKMGHGVNIFAMGVANARACELEIISGAGDNLSYGLGDFKNFDRFAQAVKEIAQEKEKKCA